MTPPPAPGNPAPDFTLPDAEGKPVRLSDYRGRRVVLYFYPKDDTPGCTTEACEFRDLEEKFRERNAVILGISPDPPRRHLRFKEKYTLPFTLLSDEDHAVCTAYGVWVEKRGYGRTYMGIRRTTFLVGPEGRIERVFENVKPAGHAEEILEILEGGRPRRA